LFSTWDGTRTLTGYDPEWNPQRAVTLTDLPIVEDGAPFPKRRGRQLEVVTESFSLARVERLVASLAPCWLRLRLLRQPTPRVLSDLLVARMPSVRHLALEGPSLGAWLATQLARSKLLAQLRTLHLFVPPEFHDGVLAEAPAFRHLDELSFSGTQESGQLRLRAAFPTVNVHFPRRFELLQQVDGE
jgi:hypothetical protein